MPRWMRVATQQVFSPISDRLGGWDPAVDESARALPLVQFGRLCRIASVLLRELFDLLTQTSDPHHRGVNVGLRAETDYAR